MIIQQLPPAELIVGSHEATVTYTHKFLQKIFCPEACAQCTHCSMIVTKQHHGALWFCPEKRYTLEQLEPIGRIMTLSLQPHDHFFFIIEKAELLTPSCANSLLKLVEEPPQGYHFIFLAPQPQLVINTIRSRCQVVRLEETTAIRTSGFLHYFMEQRSNAATFLKEVATEAPEDYEVPACIAALTAHWTEQLVHTLQQKDDQRATYAHAMLTLLKQATENPPMPGSAKLFWRDLYLRTMDLRP